jgi:hypothetical protein
MSPLVSPEYEPLLPLANTIRQICDRLAQEEAAARRTASPTDGELPAASTTPDAARQQVDGAPLHRSVAVLSEIGSADVDSRR